MTGKEPDNTADELKRGSNVGWTAWRLLAQRTAWFDDNFDYDGAACYKLSITGLRGGDPRIVYAASL